MEVRRIKKTEWDALRKFNEEQYGPRHILTNKVYYDWQFDNFANEDHESYPTLGIFGKDRILFAVLGTFPLPYTFFGRDARANCLANLIVDKKVRSIGYGYLLLEHIESFNDLAIDHTINDAAWPLFMKAGWRGETLKRYLYIINSERLGRLIPEGEAPDFQTSFRPGISASGRRFNEIKKLDASIDSFWTRARFRYPVTIRRNADYLNWRYMNHPLVSYRVFTVQENADVRALVVIRVEKPQGLSVARIIDFIAEEDAEGFTLARTIEECRKTGIDFIDYFSSGSFHEKSLFEQGFVNGDKFPYSSLPILYNPVSFKRKHLNFAVKIMSDKLSQDKGFNLAHWYTTKGGGDQDRP